MRKRTPYIQRICWNYCRCNVLIRFYSKTDYLSLRAVLQCVPDRPSLQLHMKKVFIYSYLIIAACLKTMFVKVGNGYI